jgi:titin
VDPTGYRAAGNGYDGVLVTGAGNTIGGTRPADRVVVSGNARAGIEITGPQAKWNKVLGTYVGSDCTGFASVANGTGILITSGAQLNKVGDGTRAGRNVITGNYGDQLVIAGTGASANIVQGNFIGVDSSGEAGSLSGGSGVKLAAGATNNVIGGTALGTGNLIGGAGRRLTNGVAVGVGIELDDAGTTGNVVQGNWVGLDARGVSPISNMAGGILVRAAGNTVGGTGTARNVIADTVNSPGLGGWNTLLPPYWYVDTVRYLGHPELIGGSFRV